MRGFFCAGGDGFNNVLKGVNGVILQYNTVKPVLTEPVWVWGMVWFVQVQNVLKYMHVYMQSWKYGGGSGGRNPTFSREIYQG